MSLSSIAADTVKQFLPTKFWIKTLGSLKYFLGMEMTRSKADIQIYQRKYTLDLLSETGLLAAKPSPLPMDPNVKLQKDVGDLFYNPNRYQQLVSKLLYLTNTRLDLSYSVNLFSQFMDTLRIPHYDTLIIVIRYLKNTSGQGLFFSATSSLHLIAHCFL